MTPELFKLIAVSLVIIAVIVLVFFFVFARKIEITFEQEDEKNYSKDVDWLLELDEHEKSISA